MRSDDIVVSLRERIYDGYCKLDRIRLRHPLFRGGLGPEIEREICQRGHAVAILPYDPDADRVLLIRQFRVPAMEAGWPDPWLWEIPAGVIDEGETAEQVAQRELEEETGCRARSLERICEYMTSPGVITERVTLYLARVESEGAGGVHGLAEEGEDISVHAVPRHEAMVMLTDGRASNAILLIALQWLEINHGRLRRSGGESSPP